MATNHLHHVIDRGYLVVKVGRLALDRGCLGADRGRLVVDRAGLAYDRGSIVLRECLKRIVHRLHPPVIKNHGLTVRSPLKGLEEELRYSVRFNGLRKASPEFHSRAGDHRSEIAVSFIAFTRP